MVTLKCTSADIPFKCHSYGVSTGWVHCGDYGVTMGKEPKASSSVGFCDRNRNCSHIRRMIRRSGRIISHGAQGNPAQRPPCGSGTHPKGGEMCWCRPGSLTSSTGLKMIASRSEAVRNRAEEGHGGILRAPSGENPQTFATSEFRSWSGTGSS